MTDALMMAFTITCRIGQHEPHWHPWTGSIHQRAQRRTSIAEPVPRHLRHDKAAAAIDGRRPLQLVPPGVAFPAILGTLDNEGADGSGRPTGRIRRHRRATLLRRRRQLA
jgi:hypothetical protein